MFREVMESIEREISASRAFQHLMEIHRTDRWFTFSMFRETAEYCAHALRQGGARDVELLELKADGRTAYGDWVIPQAWKAKDAELWVVEPEDAAGRIVRYLDEPCCLVMYSAPTAPEGVEAELVVIEDQAELETADVRGRMLLISSKPKEILDLAVEKGAIGIVSDYIAPLPPIRDRMDLPDAVRWENDCFVPVNEGELFGFSISPRAGDRLRSLARREVGKGRAIRLFARVDTRLYDGTVPMVSGLIPGHEREEVILCTHLYEPGANDNASGCGVSLEIARCLNALIASQELPQPKRGIRFLLGWECAGFMGYAVHHRDRIPDMVAGLNVDMVGGNQDRNRAYLHLRTNPHAAMSYTDHLMRKMIEFFQVERNPLLRWGEDRFGICDNLYADPMIGVPVPSLIQHPDIVWHSSVDTVDRIDPPALKQVATLAATYLYFVADAGYKEASWLASGMATKGMERMGAYREHLLVGVSRDLGAKPSPEKPERLWNRFEEDMVYRLDRELEALYSTLRLVDAEDRSEMERYVGDLAEEITASGETMRRSAERTVHTWTQRVGGVFLRQERDRPRTPDEEEADRIVPVRTVFGSLTFFPLPAERCGRSRWDPYYHYALNCPLFWADGERSLLEIYRLVEKELGKADLRDLLEYVRFLVDRGYMKLR